MLGRNSVAKDLGSVREEGRGEKRERKMDGQTREIIIMTIMERKPQGN